MEFNEETMRSRLKSVKDKIDPKLLANSAFSNLFRTGCKTAVSMTGRDLYKVIVSDDGKMVRIFDEAPNVLVRDELSFNRHINSTTISLDGDSVTCEFASGTIYRPEDLRKIGQQVDEGFSGLLNTYYSYQIYDENGIELSNSYFSDSCLLNGYFPSISIVDQVLSELHKPTFYYNSAPRPPKFYYNANSGCTYRRTDNLGVAYSSNLKGIKMFDDNREVKYSIFPVNTEYPEILQPVLIPIATYSVEKNDYVVSPSYSGKTLYQLETEFKNSFRSGIENSKTKQYNPAMYESLIRLTNQEVNNK